MAADCKHPERLLFPCFLLAAQVVFFVLFILFVRYDVGGRANREVELLRELNKTGRVPDIDELVSKLESTKDTTKLYPFFQDIHVMIFIGFGFLMTFLRRYGYGSIGFNLLLAAFAIQWSTLAEGLLSFIDQIGSESFVIHVNFESMINSDFAAAAVLITFGSMLGRASPFQLITIAFFELIFYAGNVAINSHVFKAADVGGSMLIHTFGAYFGLSASIMLNIGKPKDHARNSSVYHSDMFAMIGTIFLWVFWPSFNGGLATGNAQYRAIINTYFSLTGSVVASYIFSMFVHGNKKLDMVHVQNATLAGGVAVGSVADMLIDPWAALLIGIVSGVVSVLGYRFLSPLMERLHIYDTCGVHNLHGMPGVLSAVASAVAAAVAHYGVGMNKVGYGESLYLVFPARAPSNITAHQILLGIEPANGRTAIEQAGYQLALLASTLMIAIIGGLLSGTLVRVIPLFQPVKEDSLFDDKPYWQLPDDADGYLPGNGDGETAPLVVAVGDTNGTDGKEHEVKPMVDRKEEEVVEEEERVHIPLPIPTNGTDGKEHEMKPMVDRKNDDDEEEEEERSNNPLSTTTV